MQMDPLSKLTEYFKEFPGIGPRQAKRFVYFLLTRNSAYLEELSKLITEIKKNVKMCSSCFRFFQSSNGMICPICSDKDRNPGQLMVISRDVDFEAIEKSKVYNGYYFVLGGMIPILDKEHERRVRLNDLKNKILKTSPKEIIISMSITADGENTTLYLKDFITEINKDIKITIPGRGVSTGSELEYSDKETIKSALENRSTI
jgi:recombination protein RecR